jgi:hypothetical protein
MTTRATPLANHAPLRVQVRTKLEQCCLPAKNIWSVTTCPPKGGEARPPITDIHIPVAREGSQPYSIVTPPFQGSRADRARTIRFAYYKLKACHPERDRIYLLLTLRLRAKGRSLLLPNHPGVCLSANCPPLNPEGEGPGVRATALHPTLPSCVDSTLPHKVTRCTQRLLPRASAVRSAGEGSGMRSSNPLSSPYLLRVPNHQLKSHPFLSGKEPGVRLNSSPSSPYLRVAQLPITKSPAVLSGSFPAPALYAAPGKGRG